MKQYLLLALVVLLALPLGALAQGESPGGQFSERLRQARERLSPSRGQAATPTVRPAVKPPARAAVQRRPDAQQPGAPRVVRRVVRARTRVARTNRAVRAARIKRPATAARTRRTVEAARVTRPAGAARVKRHQLAARPKSRDRRAARSKPAVPRARVATRQTPAARAKLASGPRAAHRPEVAARPMPVRRKRVALKPRPVLIAGKPRAERREPQRVRRAARAARRETERVVERAHAARPGRHRLIVTYSIDPRDSSGSPWPTGDVVLFADPQGTPVHFRWEGGGRRTRSSAILKGFLPQTMRFTASAPELSAEGAAWVPIHANCITTVRFTFAGVGSGRQARR
jgi:hypothetical protein